MSNEERIARGAEHALEDIAYELHLIREALQALAPKQVTDFTLTQIETKLDAGTK